ncbi:MAG: hypothetical protein G3M78_14910 [Candidatus Nitrohelix vancouverensis]|uniref:Uncharacterized protein n=1 Tax=Candidatus Nitrohelix vancouverensis TaxID=2705534 RepID=A0A7T0C527_9BACT|nr:MAG: hypothetical protein G3M78_14910 [Candidatus Nitrohelix vancouverensis]
MTENHDSSTLYDLLSQCARSHGTPQDPEVFYPELGSSLSLFHECLLEAGLKREETLDRPHVCEGPEALQCAHLSQFIIAFLPFNSVTEKSEFNQVIFDLFSFFQWMDRNKIPHALNGVDLGSLLRDLSAMQERCLQLSHYLDDQSARTLKDPPELCRTVTDFFKVVSIENGFLCLQGRRDKELMRLKLPENILSLARINDQLDLTLGDTSERWVMLEAGQVFPKAPETQR